MSYAKQIEELSRRFQELSDASSRAKGELSSLIAILEEEYGVKTKEEAEGLLESLKEQQSLLEEKLEKAIESIKEVLDEYDEDEDSDDSE